MDGVPIFSLFPLGLPATDLRGFSGVLNSTTNVVLTEIEKGRSFDEAIRRAQQMGIAETDPSADLDGWDAAVKVAALAIVLLGVPLKLDQVRRTGIRELSEEKIRSVRNSGMRYKLVCRAERRGVGVDCSVQPELLLASDPLANLEGSSSAIRFDLDVFGLSLVEHNPGIEATGYGLARRFHPRRPRITLDYCRCPVRHHRSLHDVLDSSGAPLPPGFRLCGLFANQANRSDEVLPVDA